MPPGPRMYRSTNGRAGSDPEIWFRVVHVAVDGQDGAPVAAPARRSLGEGGYREQTVEIALGPKGAFKNGNVGRLTCLRRGFGRQARRVPADQVISAIPPPRGKPKPPKEPRTPRLWISSAKSLSRSPAGVRRDTADRRSPSGPSNPSRESNPRRRRWKYSETSCSEITVSTPIGSRNP
jgi:hypothetical protein